MIEGALLLSLLLSFGAFWLLDAVLAHLFFMRIRFREPKPFQHHLWPARATLLRLLALALRL